MSQVPVNSFDVLLDVHKDIVPVVPMFAAQIREKPKYDLNTHFDSYLPSHHALVDDVADHSSTHEWPDGYTAHLVDDSHRSGRVFDPVSSSSVLSSSSTDASFSRVSHLLSASIHCESFQNVLSSPTSRVRGERCCHIRSPASSLPQ